jgi:hypothetical protein
MQEMQTNPAISSLGELWQRGIWQRVNDATSGCKSNAKVGKAWPLTTRTPGLEVEDRKSSGEVLTLRRTQTLSLMNTHTKLKLSPSFHQRDEHQFLKCLGVGPLRTMDMLAGNVRQRI